MRNKPILLILLFTVVVVSVAYPQAQYLQSGPMLGYSDMREVMLWVQTNAPARVKIEYWDAASPQQRFATEEVMTGKAEAFTAKLIADKVQPGGTYGYALFINGKKVDRPYPLHFQTQKLWQWREDPPPFKIVVGSCAYVNEPAYDRPGKPYGGDYQIFTSIFEKQPDAMLWLGDNTYLREADWNTRTGILHRYTHTRSLPELQPLLASVHHYAIWDDHDYGPNDSDRSYWNKQATYETFKLFWGNPSFGFEALLGISTLFQWADVDFLLLDDRTFRSPNDRKTGERAMFGQAQLDWLIDALAASRAPFKIVATGGQVLNPAARFETLSTFAAEREKLLRALEQESIPGVVFVTGDRHFAELTKLDRRGTYPLYDLTTSPLTAGPATGENEGNYLRVEGTYYADRNFAILEFSGPRTAREMKMVIYDKEGKEVWSRVIKAQELR